RFDAAALAAPQDLWLVQQTAVGVDGIDLEAARARGVPVCNAPGANADAVAQAALLLILALARRLPAAQRSFQGGVIGVPLGRELASGRLGGFGAGVHWREPWDPSDPLYAREDVVALPHVAGSTEEAFERLAAVVAENLRRVVGGEELLHRIV